MNDTNWQEAVSELRPYVIRIETPEHQATGFLFAFAVGGEICGFATAAHALKDPLRWEQPLRVHHVTSGAERLLRPTDRSIVIDEGSDTAALVFARDGFPAPARLLEMTPEAVTLRVGVEVGWVGFPAVARTELCFFSGRISAWLEEKDAYLVDGVAIQGVSGGPAFAVDAVGHPVLLGVVSAYLPAKTAGSALPGLSVVQHIGQLAKWVRSLKSLESDYGGGAGREPGG